MPSPFHFIPNKPFSTYNPLKDGQFNHLPIIIDKFLSLLQGSSKNLNWVKSIHAQVITNSLSNDQFVATKLVKAYSDLGSLEAARYVFDQFLQPKGLLCNAMLGGYLQNGQHRETLHLFGLMRFRNLEVNSCSCTFALKACASSLNYEMGMEIIRSAVEKGMEKNRFVGSSMISFLVRFDKIGEARRVFDGMPDRDVVCWNSIIGGYVQAGCFDVAFELFFEMQSSRTKPSPITMTSLIQACGGIGDLKLGKCLHGCVLGLGMGNDILVLTSFVDMYCKIGNMDSARQVFQKMLTRNLVSWNAMISGCVRNGLVGESFDLFHKLVRSGCGFDLATIVSLLQGCSKTANLEIGKILHGCAIRSFDSNLILSTAIVDLYSKCGSLKQATYVFNRMKDRNVITWTAMLVGLAQNGHAEDALTLFAQMQEEGIAANSVTLVSLVHCCSHLGSLKRGRSIHAHVLRSGFAFDVVSMTALVDMYAKCGKINLAERIFSNGSISKDVVLWNSMITGYSMHGHGYQAVSIYHKMMEEGIKPNQTTFLSLLSACSHSKLVEQGISLFYSMERDYNIRPTEKHYACLVDLLSRAGRFEEAKALIEKMPFQPDTAVLEALLSGCRTHKEIDLGIQTAGKLLSLDPMNPGIYIMLSNIYGEARRWEKVDYIRSLMRKHGLKKTPGYSIIEVGNQVHAFFAGDDSHPKWEEIHHFLGNLRSAVEASGYVPDTSCVLRDVDEQMKVRLLWGHSERLAIAFGLLTTAAGSLIRITKNLRVCRDCHIVSKYISKIVNREIIVRDANRFHHFSNGGCSCGDYW